MNKQSRFLLAALAAAILPSAVMTAEASPRPLRVALYPYVPDIGVFKDVLTNTWNRTGRTEGIEFISWDCYNDDFPTNADVVVSECGFLDSYVAEKRLRPIIDPPLSQHAVMPDGLSFVNFAFDGCVARDVDGVSRLFGLPQMICTYYVFGRKGEPLPSGFDFNPLANGENKPGKKTGLLFYATGDDMTFGIVRLYLDRVLGDEKRGGAVLKKILAAGGKEQLSFYPDNGDGFVRADWFRDGTGANYIDYSEALSRLAAGGRGGDFTYRRLVGFGAPYFVNPVSVTATCPEDLLPAAAECLRILTSREYLSAVLWPEGKIPAYVLPGRMDVFQDFAARDAAYADFLRDASLPGNVTWRLPADAKSIILDAAKASADPIARNKAAMRRFETCINENDLALGRELISEKAAFATPVSPEPFHGAEGYLSVVSLMRASFPDVQWKLEDMVADEKTVAVRWTCSGTFTGKAPFAGIQPNGRKFSTSVMNFYVFDDEGKIIDDIAATGMLGILQGIGVVVQ